MVDCSDMKEGTEPLVFRKTPRTFTFAGHTLDLAHGSLMRGSEEVKLRPKSYETLRYLVENAGRLIPKIELVAVLWPDAASVSEDSLTHCVMDVRRALDDSRQEIIRTLPGRGYLFAATIEAPPDTVEPPATATVPVSPAGVRRIPTRAAIGVALALLAVAGLVVFLADSASRKWVRNSIPGIEELAAAGKYPEAYELAMQVLARKPAELRVTSLLPEISDDLSVATNPAGAEVYLRRLGPRARNG